MRHKIIDYLKKLYFIKAFYILYKIKFLNVIFYKQRLRDQCKINYISHRGSRGVRMNLESRLIRINQERRKSRFSEFIKICLKNATPRTFRAAPEERTHPRTCRLTRSLWKAAQHRPWNMAVKIKAYALTPYVLSARVSRISQIHGRSF